MASAEWAKVVRGYRKAIGAVDAATEHLTVSALDGDYDSEVNTMTALAVLKRAADALNDLHDAARKRLGVAIYTPYGRPARRRW